MTDYLEEHLEQADALLKQVRKMEQGMSVLPQNEEQKETEQENLPGAQTKTIDVSKGIEKVDDLSEQVGRVEDKVDNLADDAEI